MNLTYSVLINQLTTFNKGEYMPQVKENLNKVVSQSVDSIKNLHETVETQLNRFEESHVSFNQKVVESLGKVNSLGKLAEKVDSLQKDIVSKTYEFVRKTNKKISDLQVALLQKVSKEAAPMNKATK